MNLGDLWQYPFLASVWGTAGQWVGSLLTAGSLFLGFKVLRVNQKDKRIGQASKITFTARFSEDMETDNLSGVRGKVFNHSDALIMNVAIVVRLNKEVLKRHRSRASLLFDPIPGLVQYVSVMDDEDEYMDKIIQPGDYREYSSTIPQRFRNIQPEHVEAVLRFADANSVVWERTLYRPPAEFKFHGWRENAIKATIVRWRRTKGRVKSLVKVKGKS
ncbi:hypothetical protein CIW49_24465 [Mycolicibacterium sp. P1-18]|uniref:hypothetical protein n=1 Tax=Mycolicibacterium sp. P1-18 TaxID=2024615 RepID=UPI0011F3BADF|nr:hypothetical protein [Mycolicibacterium sp. P1-18]KAA0094707.1 hypothetical protein CIW49_24465 [Mycolicibacterium sp. P1-18]